MAYRQVRPRGKTWRTCRAVLSKLSMNSRSIPTNRKTSKETFLVFETTCLCIFQVVNTIIKTTIHVQSDYLLFNMDGTASRSGQAVASGYHDAIASRQRIRRSSAVAEMKYLHFKAQLQSETIPKSFRLQLSQIYWSVNILFWVLSLIPIPQDEMMSGERLAVLTPSSKSPRWSCGPLYWSVRILDPVPKTSVF